MADTQSGNEDVREWFLRIGGETVFGPVSTQGLIVWAEQGRILPGHEVSTDRKKWVQAVSVELLDMRWYVDDGEGELRGPLNRLAAEALLKSGKVPEGAQLISADEVETENAAEQPQPAKRAERAREAMPEEVLRGRIRDLESMVSTQRERLAKLTDSAALETIQHERDVLSSLVKETESQRDAILRNAEKDARAHERKQELLRQQIKKLEQQLEDANSRLLLSCEAASVRADQVDRAEADRMVEEARRTTAEEVGRQAAATEAALRGEVDHLRAQVEASASECEALRVRCERERSERQEAEDGLSRRLAELKQTLLDHEKQAEKAALALASLESELSAAKARGAELERQLAQTQTALRSAEESVRENEAAFAELLNDANVRDNGYLEKIAALEKACAQSPDETARFYADRAAVYELVKAEVSELSKSMELERQHVEQLKEWSAQRLQSLVERRQILLKHMGDSPGEMTRRAVREQPSDPQTARLRAELENLRVTYQRELRFSETREREVQDKMRVLEAECSRLTGQAAEGEKRSQRLSELEDVLRRREHELSDERRARDAEREQFQSNQQALLLRIETLERSAKPTTPDEIQTAEARNVKLASWMRLKR